MFPVPAKYRSKPVDKTLAWFTLCVSSRLFQTKVFSFLEDYVSWIPEKRIVVYSGDDCYTEYEPLYPGYVFIGLHHGQKASILEKSAKQYNPSFSLLKTMSGSPHSMTAKELDEMTASLLQSNSPKLEKSLKLGEKVSIKSGPLAGNTGVVKKVTGRQVIVRAIVYGKEMEMRVKRDNFIFLERYDKD